MQLGTAGLYSNSRYVGSTRECSRLPLSRLACNPSGWFVHRWQVPIDQPSEASSTTQADNMYLLRSLSCTNLLRLLVSSVLFLQHKQTMFWLTSKLVGSEENFKNLRSLMHTSPDHSSASCLTPRLSNIIRPLVQLCISLAQPSSYSHYKIRGNKILRAIQ